MTSVYIHILPALVTYVWRWFPEEADTLRIACDGRDDCVLDLENWFLYPLVFYFAWQVFYLWFTGASIEAAGGGPGSAVSSAPPRLFSVSHSQSASLPRQRC